MEARRNGLSARSAKKIFTFIFLLSGWALVVPSCFALSLTSAFHVIRDITERKKSTQKARYGKNESGRQLAGEEVPGQRNVRSWPFGTACMYYIHIN